MRKRFQPQGLFICKQTEHNRSEVLLKMNVSKVFLDMQITSELFPPPPKRPRHILMPVLIQALAILFLGL